MSPCTIYALINPIDNNVFYVGKTCEKMSIRYSGHITEAKRGNKEKDLLIKEIIAKGKKPRVKILQVKKYPNYKWFNMSGREKYWVEEMQNRGYKLTNKVYAKKITWS